MNSGMITIAGDIVDDSNGMQGRVDFRSCCKTPVYIGRPVKTVTAILYQGLLFTTHTRQAAGDFDGRSLVSKAARCVVAIDKYVRGWDFARLL